MLKTHSQQLLADRYLITNPDSDDIDWLEDLIAGLQVDMDNPLHPSGNNMATQRQRGYLVGLMQCEYRDERLKLLEIFLGREIDYDGVSYYPGRSDNPVYPHVYPGESLKDLTITQNEMSVLIDFYASTPADGRRIMEILGYVKRTPGKAELC